MTKNWIALSISLLLSLLIVQPSSGQRLLKNIQKRAEQSVERKIEQRANEKIDEKIDESLDKIEESMEKDKDDARNDTDTETSTKNDDSSRALRMLKGMGFSGEPVPIADSYDFDYLIQMHIETYKKSGKLDSEGEFITYLNPNTKSMGYQVVSGNMGQSDKGMFIIDAENGASIILSEEKGQKTGVVTGIGSFMESLGDTYEEEVDLSQSPETYLANPNVKKTGRTKTVAGYKCEEYVYSDEDTESEVWITKDLKMNTQDFFSTLFKVNMASAGMGWGYMMESTSTNKGNGEKSIMKVTKVDKNANMKFNMGEYQITNIGSITMPKQ